MPRRLRIEFEGAIYHVMARGNARQKIVRDDADRQRLIDALEQAVIRYGWELPSYVVMGNHLHLLVKTLRPNPGEVRHPPNSIGEVRVSPGRPRG
jgi:putative transposase